MASQNNYSLSDNPPILQYQLDNNHRKQSVLHRPCKAVSVKEIQTPAFQFFLKQLYLRMVEHRGMGIAANQCGVDAQAFIIEYHTKARENKRYFFDESVPKQVFINPVILEASDDILALYHGCLSCQNLPRGLVGCYKEITIEALDETGKKFKRTLTQLASIIFQHEFCHLLGRTYYDHAKKCATIEELQARHGGQLPDYYQPSIMENIPMLVSRDEVGKPISA